MYINNNRKGCGAMQVWFVFSLIFSMIVVVFAALNSEIVIIKLFWVNYELSQSVVILVSAAFGAAIAIFLGLFSKIKSSFKIRELTNNLKNAVKKKQKPRVNASGNTAGNASAYSSGNTAAAEKKPADSGQSEGPAEE